MMRKVLLISVLLLALALISTTPTVAKGPPRIEKKVIFNDALDGDGLLFVDEKGKNIAVYGYLPMTFYFEGYEGDYWKDFGLRLTLKGTETGEVEMGAGFDMERRYLPEGDCVKNIPNHHFSGSGFFHNYGEGVYEVTLDDAAIYDVVASTNKKCQGYGLEFIHPFTVSPITFTLKIGDD